MNKTSKKKLLADVEKILEEKIRPALKMHAGGVNVVDFDPKTNTLYVKMHGTCDGCGFANETLYGFIEEELRTNIPDIEAVEPADSDNDEHKEDGW